MRTALELKEWLALLWLGSGKLLTIPLVTFLARQPFSRKHRVLDVELEPGQTEWELRSAWVLLTDPLVLGVLLASGLLRLAEDSLATAAFTFVALFVWAELWMYWVHRAMHRFDFLFKVHEHHHRSVVPQALTATSFSLAEKLFVYTCGWLGFATILSRFAPVSLAGIVAYYSFYFVTSPLAHANFETSGPDSFHARWGIGRLLGTSTGHALHHARCEGNYGFLTSATDRLFGTYLPDTRAVHHRVWEGRALQRTDERLDEAAAACEAS